MTGFFFGLACRERPFSLLPTTAVLFYFNTRSWLPCGKNTIHISAITQPTPSISSFHVSINPINLSLSLLCLILLLVAPGGLTDTYPYGANSRMSASFTELYEVTRLSRTGPCAVVRAIVLGRYSLSMTPRVCMCSQIKHRASECVSRWYHEGVSTRTTTRVLCGECLPRCRYETLILIYVFNMIPYL